MKRPDRSRHGDEPPLAARQACLEAASLRRRGMAVEAAAAYRKALRIHSAIPAAHNNLGNILCELGQDAEAASCYRRALALDPDYAAAHANLGSALKSLGKLEQAVACHRRALALNPAFVDAHYNLGNALLELNRPSEAEAAYRQAIALEPDHTDSLANLGRCLREMGRLAESEAATRAALAIRPDPRTHSNLLFCLQFHAQAEDILAEGRRWAEIHGRVPPMPKHPRIMGQRLRIGYVSPDFRTHSCAYFIEPLLANHDRNRVEVFCYADLGTPDATTRRLKALAEHWREIAPFDDATVAAMVAADGIDVLIDLAGHSAHNRLGVFAHRPARVQASWLGFPSTTGLSAIDFRISDAIADPPGTAEAQHVERLARLKLFLCYRPSPDAPEVAPPPCARNGFVTFGSFNALAKVTPSVIALWSRLLASVKGAKLLLKSQPLADHGVREDVLVRFQAHGIAAERLELVGFIPDGGGHLGAYANIDIALDPFPYNGTTTTCEALWMGVPVVTLAGQRHAARVGTSLLTNLDLPDLVAATEADYVGIAAGLAEDAERLASLRGGLRERMRASPLCDGAGFARAFEKMILVW